MRRQQFGVCLRSAGQPVRNVSRLRQTQWQLRLEPIQLFGAAVGQAFKGITLNGQIIFGGDFGRNRTIKISLRFVGVNNSRRPNIKRRLRLRQLSCKRLFGRPRKTQCVLGQQHIEIRFRHAQNQVLFRTAVLIFRNQRTLPPDF